jgi:hypothetical protein
MVGEGVAVGVRVGVAVLVAVGVRVGVAVLVGVGVTVGVGVPGESRSNGPISHWESPLPSPSTGRT